MLPILIGAAVAFLLLFLTAVKFVKERSALVVERFGKYNRILHPGLNFLIPVLDKVSRSINLKIQQMNVHVETKTKDNVFIKLQASVHVQVMSNKVKEACYELDDPYAQISSYIFDVVRAEVPKLDLDDVFVRKDDIANAVKAELSENMEIYGFRIIQTLITDIDPDGLVKESMNRINAARRNKEALSEDAEGRKIAKIKDAEAEKELGSDLFQKVRLRSLALYQAAQIHCAKVGIILADTKFEFGLDDKKELLLIDELLTPDSSRFWPADHYRPGSSPPSFDKQFVRDYLTTLKDWNRQPPGPTLPLPVIQGTLGRYRQACRLLTGSEPALPIS